MANVVCLHSSMQEEDILERVNAKYSLCILYSTCTPLCKIGMHFTTPSDILVPSY